MPAPYDRLWVCGLDNTEQGTPDGRAALAGADGLRLILMHSPDGLTALGDEPFAVAFTGHVHGGQFVLPGGKSLISSKGPLSQRYLYGGLFELGGPGERILLVSRGIGQGSLPMRFRADPEVHVCDLSSTSVGSHAKSETLSTAVKLGAPQTELKRDSSVYPTTGLWRDIV